MKEFIRKRLDPKGWLYQFLWSLYNPKKASANLKRTFAKSSIFDDADDLNACSLLPEDLLRGVFDLVNPKTILDVGCGTGRSLDWFLEHGADVVGVEGSSMAISHARHPERIQQFDLNQVLSLGKRFDLVWCFEVAEHIHPTYVHNFIRSLTDHSNTILMSAAHPGQGGTGHFNEQPRSYWLDLLRASGYEHDDEGCRKIIENWEWYPENVFFFRRRI